MSVQIPSSHTFRGADVARVADETDVVGRACDRKSCRVMLPNLAGVVIERIDRVDGVVEIDARARGSTAICPELRRAV